MQNSNTSDTSNSSLNLFAESGNKNFARWTELEQFYSNHMGTDKTEEYDPTILTTLKRRKLNEGVVPQQGNNQVSQQQQATTLMTPLSQSPLNQHTNVRSGEDVISKYNSLQINSFVNVSHGSLSQRQISPNMNMPGSSSIYSSVIPSQGNTHKSVKSAIPSQPTLTVTLQNPKNPKSQEKQVPITKERSNPIAQSIPTSPKDSRFVRGNPEALYRERVKTPSDTSQVKISQSETFASSKVTSEISEIITNMQHPGRSATMISYYLGQSDRFLEIAHESSIHTCTKSGLDNYNKLIKLAIKLLLIVSKKYKLSPKHESIVYYRLGKIYFTETTNSDKAEEYINKAIKIAKFHEFVQIQFYSELLLGKILETTNAKLSANFISSKFQYYKEKGYSICANLFQLLRIKNLIISDCSTALVVLQGLIQDPELNNSVKCICLIYEANLHCYRGSPEIATKLLSQAEELTRDLVMPVQVEGMILLGYLSAYSNMNLITKMEAYRNLISKYMKTQSENNWKEWNDNGIVNVELSIDDTNIPFFFPWISSDEFKISYYFVTAMAYISRENYSGKVFDKCSEMISDLRKVYQGNSTRRLISPGQIKNKLLKLRYLQFLIAFYKTWIGFLKGDYKKITNMNAFMSENNSKFTNEEYACFKPLFPQIYYMFAAHYQEKGDIQAAKYYYLKVRTMTSESRSDKTSSLSLLQFELGIGCDALSPKGQFNELYVFSSIQLLILLEFQLLEINQNVTNLKDQQMIEEHVNLKSELIQELKGIFKPKQFSNSFAINFTNSNLFLTITYLLISDILSETNDSITDENLNTFLHEGLKLLGNKTTFKLLQFLICNYILSKSSNADEKENVLNMLKYQAAQNVDSQTIPVNDFQNIIRLFLLHHLKARYDDLGDLQNSEMAELQSQFYYERLYEKFRFLFENAKYFDKRTCMRYIDSVTPPTTSENPKD